MYSLNIIMGSADDRDSARAAARRRQRSSRRIFALGALCVGLIVIAVLWRSRQRAATPTYAAAAAASADAFVLRNAKGVEVHILRTGAAIQRLYLPDRDGQVDDVVLGYEREAPYASASNPYFGVIAGRVANRIANATFTLDGVVRRLAVNEAGFPGSLHGGRVGFDKRPWDGKRVSPYALKLKLRRRGQAVKLSLQSAAGEEGYPGTLQAQVVYTLRDPSDTDANASLGELVQSIIATSDAP